MCCRRTGTSAGPARSERPGNTPHLRGPPTVCILPTISPAAERHLAEGPPRGSTIRWRLRRWGVMSNAVNTAELGRKAKALRLARGMTLDDVVSRTEFTVSWLSKLENGLLTPSLDGLVRLAQVLECGVEDLVDGLLARPRIVVTKHASGRVDDGRNGKAGHTVEHLSEAWRGRGMETTVLHLTKGRIHGQPMSDTGERFLHVLDGDVQLVYDDTTRHLSTGDSVYLDARVPHSLHGDTRRRARILSVLVRDSGRGNGRTKRVR